MPHVDLSDFLAHIGEAIKIARDKSAGTNIACLRDYLERYEDEDFYRLRTVPIKIGNEIIDVPLFGLTPQGHLDLDTISIEFETIIGINPGSAPDAEDTSGNPAFSISFTKGMLSRSSEMKVKACFSLKDATETSEQIRDKINKLIPIANRIMEE